MHHWELPGHPPLREEADRRAGTGMVAGTEVGADAPVEGGQEEMVRSKQSSPQVTFQAVPEKTPKWGSKLSHDPRRKVTASSWTPLLTQSHPERAGFAARHPEGPRL